MKQLNVLRKLLNCWPSIECDTQHKQSSSITYTSNFQEQFKFRYLPQDPPSLLATKNIWPPLSVPRSTLQQEM